MGPRELPPLLRDVSMTLLPFLAGLAVARLSIHPPGWLLDTVLTLLVFLAGFEIGYNTPRHGYASLGRAFRQGVLLAASTLAASALIGLALSRLLGLPPCVSAAIAAASGWYSLIAPLVASRAPSYTAVALLSNMLREQLHIALYPLLARLGLRSEAVAIGGATTMDTGLPVVLAAAGPREAALAATQGVLLTGLLPAILPAILSAC